MPVSHALETTDTELVGLERPRRSELVDDAAAETTRRLLAHLEERDRRALAEIAAAEERLATGTFGTCEACRQPIPFARLRAVPVARLCVACEWAAEQSEPG